MNFHLDAARAVIAVDRSRAWATWLVLLLRALLVRLARLAPALLVPTSSTPPPPTVTSTMPSRDTAPVLVPSSSTSSLRSLYSLHADRPATPLSVASSRGSVDLPNRPHMERAITGLRDYGVRLSAKCVDFSASRGDRHQRSHDPLLFFRTSRIPLFRKYKTPEFAADVLRIINEVSVPSWIGLTPAPRPEDLNIYKVAGSLTNAIFFVSSRAPEHTRTKTFLLRVYGPSSGNLISRSDELRMLHILSSRYRIGPRIYGTFSNGRLEEYFDSDALTPEEMRDPTVSAWTARRMAEMHRVDVESVVGSEWRIAAEENVEKWFQPAKEVLELVAASRKEQLGLDLEKFFAAWQQYLANVLKWEEAHGRSPRVFAHNDAQYGNLLKLRKVPSNKPPHHQVRICLCIRAFADCSLFLRRSLWLTLSMLHRTPLLSTSPTTSKSGLLHTTAARRICCGPTPTRPSPSVATSILRTSVARAQTGRSSNGRLSHGVLLHMACGLSGAWCRHASRLRPQ